MKRINKFLILLCFISFGFFAPMSFASEKENHTNYLEKYPFIKDEYRPKGSSMHVTDFFLFVSPLGFLIGKGLGLGIKSTIVSKRDKNIGSLLKDYEFENHTEYMSKLMESDEVKTDHKAPVISLAGEYKEFREKLDSDFYKDIIKVSKNNKKNNLVELDSIPYMEKFQINAWMNQNYNQEEKEKINKLISDYKYLRFLGDSKLNKKYFDILKS